MKRTGLLHLYYGDGKGKTTAAMGLALRALGSGKKVVVLQFLKGGQSGEIPLLEQLGAKIYRGKAGQKFVFQMNEAEKTATRDLQNRNLAAAMTEDGLYVMLYTAWNRKKARLAVATSRDLKNWTKHGLAFDKAYNGRFNNLFCKSGSILTKLKGNQLVIDKVDGKYLMYWGEYAVYAATSDNLIDWYPVLDEKNELMKIIQPRKGHFDSLLTECGPPAVRTKHEIGRAHV